MNMATNALAAAVEGITTVVDSAVALISDLAGRLREALESEDWDAVETLTAELESNQAELAAAVAANTIAADETPAPEPTPEPEPIEEAPVEGGEEPTPEPAPDEPDVA